MAMTAEQALAAQQEVKVYGAQEDEAERFTVLANRNRRLNVQVEVIRALASSTVQFLAAIAQIGRASCRARVCQYVSISVVAVSIKKKQYYSYTFFNKN